MTIFEGQGFYSDKAALAASLRGRTSLHPGAAPGSRSSMLAGASFASPEDAASALVAALEKNEAAAMQALLGPGNGDLFSTGNELADAYHREQFLSAYRAKSVLLAQDDVTRLLAVGENAWPLPLPIVASDGKWHLDGGAGADATLCRRIGHNELGAIAVCSNFIKAQQAYAAEGRDGNPPGIFAAKLTSDRGKQNGLYWPTADDELPSPSAMPVTGIPHVAAIPKKLLYDLAPQPGGEQKPLHGYYFRMLFAQGAHAATGAKEYFVDGQLTGGIALLAWPANYRDSGLMSFIVNQWGLIFERDLGADTAAVAASIMSFDPDRSWSVVTFQPFP